MSCRKLQFGGKPIRYSTNRGDSRRESWYQVWPFSQNVCPSSVVKSPRGPCGWEFCVGHAKATSFNGLALRSAVAFDARPSLQSRADAVGQVAATPANGSPCPFPCVGAKLTERFSLADARGVGHSPPREKEDASALMRGAQGGGRENNPSPFDEPASGQAFKDLPERFAAARRAESIHILQEEPLGATFADDSLDVGPEPSFVIDTSAPSGKA